MKHNVYRGGRIHVASVKCATCIFRPGNLMHLAPGRVESMVEESIAGGGSIPCHKTLDGDNAVCRGFFDVHKHDVPALTLAERLGCITEQDPNERNER